MAKSKLYKIWTGKLLDAFHRRRTGWLANFRDVTVVGGLYLLLFFTSLRNLAGDIIDIVINISAPELDHAKLVLFGKLFWATFPLITSAIIITLGVIYGLITWRRPFVALIAVSVVMYVATYTGAVLKTGHVTRAELDDLVLGTVKYETFTYMAEEQPTSVTPNPDYTQPPIIIPPLPGSSQTPLPIPSPQFKLNVPQYCYHYPSTALIDDKVCEPGPPHYASKTIRTKTSQYIGGMGGSAVYLFGFLAFPVFWIRYGALAFFAAIVGGMYCGWALGYKLVPDGSIKRLIY